MPRVPLVDRLVLSLFGLARNLFLLQTLAFGSGALASMALSGATASPWARHGLIFGAALSGIFAGASLLLWWMRSWTPQPDRSSDPGAPLWPVALGLSLTAIGFQEGVTTSSQFGGLVLLPILMALCVPALVNATALFSGLFPILLLARLPFRPLMFPTITAMGAVIQTALAVSSWLASAAMRELSQPAVEVMSGAPDREVVQLAGELTAAVAALMSTATMLLVPTAALVAWSVFLRPSGSVACQFGRDPA
jgi:hypothetical protein